MPDFDASQIELEATSEPSTPGSGHKIIYLDTSDGYLKVKHSDGRVEIIEY